MSDRREFLRVAAASALALPFARLHAAAPPPAKLELLVVGGTFLAGHVVEAARARGHDVTVVTVQVRGDTLSLRDDAHRDFALPEGRTYASVVDTVSTVPVQLRKLVRLVGPQTYQYQFVSGTSVYARLEKPGSDEGAPLHHAGDPDALRATDQTAAGLLAACEQAAEQLLPGRVCIVRPGVIVGPGDPTGRFTYWPTRIARGGDVLAPGKPSDFVQFIDARDLAAFLVHCAETRTFGTFNTEGPPMTIGALLEACRKATKSNARLVWVDADFLAKNKVIAYRDVPLWVPAGGAYLGFGQISSAKAIAAGLHYRPLAQTIADTLAWSRSDPDAATFAGRAGLQPAREARLLEVWRKRGTKPADDAADETAPNPRKRRRGQRRDGQGDDAGAPAAQR